MTATVYVTKDFGFLRGEIYYADLDPHYGSEQGGKRPVIVIQNNTGNKFAPTVIVAADKERIQRLLGQTTPDEMYQINEALMNSLDLNGGR